MKRACIAAALTLIASQVMADGHSQGLMGTTVAITNTFQGEQTKGVETDVAAFGLKNNRFAIVGDAVEFPDFITLYDVDIASDTIRLVWGDSEMAERLSGPTPDGNHDRNYFLFDLPDGKAIKTASFDAGASQLLDGSAEPKISVIGLNRIVIDFDAGVVRGTGFNPVFAVTVGDTEG